MELKKQYRPTMIRTNAPFRGPTKSMPYSNMVNEAVHDLILLSTILDTNENKGQSDYIYQNFAQYVNGEPHKLHANIEAATTLCVPLEKKEIDTNLSSANWVRYGGCTVTSTEHGFILKTTGTAEPSGIKTHVDVEEGEKLFLRVSVRIKSGTAPHFAIGSETVNKNTGSIVKFNLPVDGSIGYVDHVIECRDRESISINLDVIRDTTDALKAAEVEIQSFELTKLQVKPLNVLPVSSHIKSRVSQLEDEIKSLLRQI